MSTCCEIGPGGPTGGPGGAPDCVFGGPGGRIGCCEGVAPLSGGNESFGSLAAGGPPYVFIILSFSE